VYDGSIFYVDGTKRNIIKHNVISRNGCVYHKISPACSNRSHYKINPRIIDYFIFGNNLILLIKHESVLVIWNNKVFGCHNTIKRCNIVNAKNGTHLYIQENEYLSIYNSIKQITTVHLDCYGLLDISPDGQKVVYQGDNHAYFSNMIKENVDDYIFTINNTYCTRIRSNLYWVKGSSRFLATKYNNALYDTYVCVQHIKHQDGLCRWIRYKLNICNVKLFDIGHLLIGLSDSKIIIFDPDNLTVLNTIHCDIDFVAYHPDLQVLVTPELDYYRVTSKYELRKFTTGMDYLHDMIPSPIMDAILLNELLFELLPYDILYTVMYSAIIKIRLV